MEEQPPAALYLHIFQVQGRRVGRGERSASESLGEHTCSGLMTDLVNQDQGKNMPAWKSFPRDSIPTSAPNKASLEETSGHVI